MFKIFVDFSGSFTNARRIICIFEDLSIKNINYKCLKHFGYSGFFGKYKSYKKNYATKLSKLLLNDVENLEKWELLIKPIIKKFLKNLVLENNFDFAEKIKMFFFINYD